MSNFIPGLELSRLFFFEAVEPIIGAAFPGLRYGAGLLGTGSEVLGFDTARSMDHDWGPRVDIFLDEADLESTGDRIDEILRHQLPRRFRGFPVSFTAADPNDNGTRLPELGESGPVNHKIGIATARQFLQKYLAFDVLRPIEPADWLTFPEQKLRSIAEGVVFRDEVGLKDLRQRFAYYPDDVWLYLLAASWTRIGQEEHLMGRAGEIGDEIGSALIGARLVWRYTVSQKRSSPAFRTSGCFVSSDAPSSAGSTNAATVPISLTQSGEGCCGLSMIEERIPTMRGPSCP